MLAIASIALALNAAIPQSQTPPKVEDPMKPLSFLAGNWVSQERAKGPDGKQVSFTLTGKNAWILEGRTMQIDESFQIEGRKFANHILMTWDGQIRKYRVYWFTNGRPFPITFTGVLADKLYVMTSDDERMRITYTLQGEGQYKAEVAMQTAEGKWDVTTVAEYRRTGR